MSKVDARFHFRNREVTRAWAGLFCAPVLLLLGTAALAQSAPRPEQLIKWRQSAYQVIGWNSGRIKAALAGSRDLAEIRAAANTLAAVANSNLISLFPPGTADGKGWRETTARDEVWSNGEKFRELNTEFAREAGTLARLAAGEDTKGVQEQFLKVANSCKACHDKFRQTD